MADFRKWFLVLAVLAVVAVPAMAQTSPTCQASPGATPFIRANGLTEQVGDILLTCTGAATARTVTFQVFVSSTTITNRLSSTTNVTACPTGIKCVTDSQAIVTDISAVPVPQANQPEPSATAGRVIGLLQPNIAAGDTPQSRNSILYPAIVIPAGTTTNIRITNIRVVAPPVVTSGLPSQVFAFVSTNPSDVTIGNPSLPIANSQIGMQFAATSTTDATAPASLSFTQCTDKNAGLISGTTGTADFSAKFTEGFPLAFKTKVQESGADTTTGSPAVALKSLGSIDAPSAVASDATKLMVRFSHIPTGVHIFVTDAPVPIGSSTSGITAAFVVPSGSTAVTLNVPTLADPTVTTPVAGHEVAVSNNAGAAEWRITENDGIGQKTLSFGVAVAWVSDTSAGSPGLTLGTPGAVAGLFSPVSTVNFAAPDSSSARIPRFVDAPQGATVFTIVPCVTNLLFPFVASTSGFDTGIALVNTSLSTSGTTTLFGNGTQHGTCTVFYFNGTTTAPDPQTTGDIVPGAVTAFTLSGGGVTGTGNTSGFLGYVIARCNFQYAHGFAFISDKNVPSLGSHGYLALVIPDRADGSRPAEPFTTGGSGEQLIQ